MFYIKGLDIGYRYAKDNEKRIFKSAYTRVDKTLSDDNKIIIDGEVYYFGNGTQNADTDKVDSLLNKISVLSNIALTGSNEYCLVTGLPLSQFKGNNEKFKSKILSYNKSEVIYKGKQLKYRIQEVEVFAQGLGALYGIGLPDGEYISFDIGSYTINIALVKMENGLLSVTHYNTWYLGVLKLYDDIIKETNSRHNLTLTNDYAEMIIKNGLSIDGEIKDTKFIKMIIKDYIDNVVTTFKSNYPVYSVLPIILRGGGSILFWDVLSKIFGNAIILPDSQYANAIGYYKYGVDKYGHML